MQVLNDDIRPRSPFKFNANWLANEGFVSLLKNSWKVFYESLVLSSATQFAMNLKIIKEVSISWSVQKKSQDLKDLVDIEVLLAKSFDKPFCGFSTEADNFFLVEIESKKRKILCESEQEAKLESRALWLLCGDDNTPFSTNMRIIGKISTLFGGFRMMKVTWLKFLSL